MCRTDVVVITFLLSLLVAFTGCKKEQTEETLPIVNTQALYTYSNRPGPSGEKSNTMSDLQVLLKGCSKESVASKNYSVAIAMHDVQNDWSRAILFSLKKTLKEYGIKITIITDGEFDVEKQIVDIHNIIRQKPDLLITLPLDSEKCSPILKKAQKAGIKLVFIDAVPVDFKIGDYGGWAVGDGFRMGVVSAQSLEESLTEGDEVALLLWKNRMFTVDERSAGAKKYLTESKKVSVIAEVFFSDFHEIPAIIDSLFKDKPTIKGLWTVWDTPAFEALGTIKKNKLDVKVATCDLSIDAAKALAENTHIIGLGVDHPYNHGITEALIAVATLEEISIPTYFVIPAQKVTRSNLSSSWENIFHKPLPNEIAKILN